jgi:hypothetical protein
MRSIIFAALIGLGATVAMAQTKHFDDTKCTDDAIGQLQLQAHNMLQANGHGDFDVTTMTLDQLVKLMAAEKNGTVDQDTVDNILKGN